MTQWRGSTRSIVLWMIWRSATEVNLNIGIDDRNENDMLSSMPGGIRGLRPKVADFHRRVKPVARK